MNCEYCFAGLTFQAESVKFIGGMHTEMGGMVKKKNKAKGVDEVELVLGEKLPKNGVS